jgi:Flp pilus assembly protein TadG
MRRDRGASLVEFALVLPLILMIVLGLVSAGVAYNLKITLTHAAREAARYAAILPTEGDTSAWLSDVETHMLADATGALNSGQPGAAYCIAFVDGSSSGTETKHIDQTGAVSAGWCFDDGRGSDEWRVQVEVQRSTTLNALVFSKSITLASQAASRYEVQVGS